MQLTQLLHKELEAREKAYRPINVAILGAGWYGSGMVQELCLWKGMRPKVLFARRPEQGVDAYLKAGIAKDKVAVVHNGAELKKILKTDRYAVVDYPEFIYDLEGVEVVFDATGNILFGAKAALATIAKGIHFVTISSELDSTIGYILKRLADEKGVIYSNSDGDQPGVLSRFIEQVSCMGFSIVVAGNCKGFIDVHKTPDDVARFVRSGHNARMVAAFTDGTKQGMEMSVVANAYGLKPDVRGMHGPRVTKDTIVDTFVNMISEEGVVDYTLGIDGINQGSGVFVIAKREGKRIYTDMEYLKKGKGPYYLFFHDHHLCYIESPQSIADAVLFNVATLAPQGRYADVFTVAKRNLKAGEKLDGMGGYMVYGVIDKHMVVRKENLLPVGLAEYAVMKQDIAKDTPITYERVDFAGDNVVLRLRKEQDRLNGAEEDLMPILEQELKQAMSDHEN